MKAGRGYWEEGGISRRGRGTRQGTRGSVVSVIKACWVNVVSFSPFYSILHFLTLDILLALDALVKDRKLQNKILCES
jgi:hypothetical protein